MSADIIWDYSTLLKADVLASIPEMLTPKVIYVKMSPLFLSRIKVVTLRKTRALKHTQYQKSQGRTLMTKSNYLWTTVFQIARQVLLATKPI